MIRESVIIGSGVCSAIECGPVPGILNVIVSRVLVLVLASRIAWRSDPAPLSFVLTTANAVGPSGTVTQAENSDVSPVADVAVAVTTCPVAAAKNARVALPLPSVVAGASPRYVAPSPLPDASHAVLP